MNFLMIIIILFAIMVVGYISYIAWELSSGRYPFRKTEKSEEIKASKKLPNAWIHSSKKQKNDAGYSAGVCLILTTWYCEACYLQE